MLLNCGAGEDSWESPLDCKEIKPVNPKGNQPWIFTGRTDPEAEAPILWPPDVKNWLTGKDPDAGKGWRQEEKGMTEDEMVGRHHRLNGHAIEQARGVGDGQGGLACCSSWGCRVGHDWATELNWTEEFLKEKKSPFLIYISPPASNHSTPPCSQVSRKSCFHSNLASFPTSPLKQLPPYF